MPTVKEKIMEMAIYRRTFVDTAGGEEEYSFMLAVRLLLITTLEFVANVS